jgi:hypothetical protein
MGVETRIHNTTGEYKLGNTERYMGVQKQINFQHLTHSCLKHKHHAA